MPFGNHEIDGGEADYDEPCEETPRHPVEEFLEEYAELVERYGLILETTARPFEIVVKTVESVIESNKGGNDYRNYHDASPETEEGILKEILALKLKEDL